PLFTGTPVGDTPVLNDLLLVFGGPAILALIFAVFAERQGRPRLGTAAGAAGLLLALVWVSLEIRRAFHGAVLTAGDAGEAELYAYSAAWLLFGAVLLGFALWRRSA